MQRAARRIAASPQKRAGATPKPPAPKLHTLNPQGRAASDGCASASMPRTADGAAGAAAAERARRGGRRARPHVAARVRGRQGAAALGGRALARMFLCCFVCLLCLFAF